MKKNSEENAFENNKRVLDALTNYFKIAEDSKATIGRNTTCLAFCLERLPKDVRDEAKNELAMLTLHAAKNGVYGMRNVFSKVRWSEGILLLGITSLFSDDITDKGFPLLDDVKTLISQIPEMSPEQSIALRSIDEGVSKWIAETLDKHGTEIINSLFSGRADEESQSKTVDTGQTTMGTREASAFLNLPHQRLMQLIDEGKITSHKTDEGVRIQVSELAGFKQSQNEASTAAMDQLTALSEELKLGY